MFPNRLKRGISELENDIKSVEAKVRSLKMQCERNENKQPIASKPQKRFEKTLHKAPPKVLNKSNTSLRPTNCCCCCCEKKKTDCCGPKTEIVADQKKIEKNHIHQKIRIPSGKTWKELLEKDNLESRRTGRRTEVIDLQKAVREAQAEKEEAERKAALQALALDKMRVLLEAKIACDRLKENTIE